ncbi:MAG: VCBS repeat-containing protein, partial [Desulfobulbaceae bacterium]|nr:VCBS repeat-containing protein [Desulfobulbaceae bacterium]
RETTPMINSAVSHWLIEHGTGYDQAIRLLQKNLHGLDDPRQMGPLHNGESLTDKNTNKSRLFDKYLLGRAWLAKGEIVKARKLFDDILVKQKDWAGVYHFLGMMALGEGKADQAIQLFATALAKGGTRQETVNELRVLLRDHYGFEGAPLEYFQAQHQGVIFRDVTEKVGLSGVQASRVAWGDYDNDDDDDLLLDGTRVFNNHLNGGFVEMAQVIPTGLAGANGGVWGDYDNDHFLDIFVTSHGANYLLHNEAGVRFSKTDAWSLNSRRVDNTEAAAWGDVNNDGYLDLYVANYEHGTVMRGQCDQDQLLVNQGGADFKDFGDGIVSEEAMCGRGVSWSDLNGDGWQDLLVANYRLDPNFLWLNQGNGTVIDVAETAGVQGKEVKGAYGHSIGSVSGDLDGDGDFDLFISNLAHPRYIEFSDQSMVLINNSELLPEFADQFSESGIIFDETSADPLLFDVDNDGDLDLYITSVYRNRSSHLYINDGKGGFTDQTWLAGAAVMNGWGAASADYDGDGYLDLLVASPEGVRLLHNEGGSNNWLAIRIDDHNCNRYGVGSKVIINYDRQRQIREITAGRGTGSQDSLTASFGLGTYTGPVSIKVKTLCGDTLQHHLKGPNRVVIID